MQLPSNKRFVTLKWSYSRWSMAGSLCRRGYMSTSDLGLNVTYVYNKRATITFVYNNFLLFLRWFYVHILKRSKWDENQLPPAKTNFKKRLFSSSRWRNYCTHMWHLERFLFFCGAAVNVTFVYNSRRGLELIQRVWTEFLFPPGVRIKEIRILKG